MDTFVSVYMKDFKWPNTRKRSDKRDFDTIQDKIKTALPGDLCSKSPPEIPPPGPVVTAQCGPLPVGNEAKHNQPETYLQKLYFKYPYLYNILKAAPDSVQAKANQVINEKFKTIYRQDYDKEGFIPAETYGELVDTIAAAKEGAAEVKPICSQAEQTCTCALDPKTIVPCKCSAVKSTRKLAWKPAAITKQVQPGNKPGGGKAKKDDSDKSAFKGRGKPPKILGNCSEYMDTYERVAKLILRERLFSQPLDESLKK